MIVNMGREIIHPAGYIDELPVGKALAHFFNGAVDIAEVRLHFFDRFAVQGNDQVQHAVCGGVLGAHVDDHIGLSGCFFYYFSFPVH